MTLAIRTVATLTVASACYGFALGSAHCWLYATRNLLKFPMLLLGTGLVCCLAYFVTARFLGARLPFGRIQELVLDLFAGASTLLASLALPVLFVGRVLASRDDGRLGEYGFFLGWNVILVASAGALALVRQARAVLSEAKVSARRAAVVTLTWLALSLFAGGQLAFWLRPFFGLPASRGVDPPFALGSAPDVRGATNFYEAVWQIVTNPPLPAPWDYLYR